MRMAGVCWWCCWWSADWVGGADDEPVVDIRLLTIDQCFGWTSTDWTLVE
jgi:hypothetical protein